jgi:hypothetical protein
MQYTLEDVQQKVSRWGEVTLVLHSGETYQIHGSEQFRVTNDADDDEETEIHVEGFDPECGEYIVAEFYPDAIEHVKTHKEV